LEKETLGKETLGKETLGKEKTSLCERNSYNLQKETTGKKTNCLFS